MHYNDLSYHLVKDFAKLLCFNFLYTFHCIITGAYIGAFKVAYSLFAHVW